MINVDTDMIIPKQYLKTIHRTGLARRCSMSALQSRRQREAGFRAQQAGLSQGQDSVAGDNFGCGSSREHAPWALLDFGIRASSRPASQTFSTATVFKNGILPINAAAGRREQADGRCRAWCQCVISVDLESKKSAAPMAA